MNVGWNVWKTEEKGEVSSRANYHNTVRILPSGNGGVGKSNGDSTELIQSSMTDFDHSLNWKVSKYWSHVWNWKLK